MIALENAKQHALKREKPDIVQIIKEVVPKICNLCDVPDN